MPATLGSIEMRTPSIEDPETLDPKAGVETSVSEGFTTATPEAKKKISDADRANATWQTLPEIRVAPRWVKEGGPGVACYGFAPKEGDIRVFFPSDAEDLDIRLTYDVKDYACRYDDVARFAWDYRGSFDITIAPQTKFTVQLPIPEGESVKEGDIAVELAPNFSDITTPE